MKGLRLDSRSSLLPCLCLLLFAFVFPFLAGFYPIVRFVEEQIDIRVFPDHIKVEGYYVYKNPFPSLGTHGGKRFAFRCVLAFWYGMSNNNANVGLIGKKCDKNVFNLDINRLRNLTGLVFTGDCEGIGEEYVKIYQELCNLFPFFGKSLHSLGGERQIEN